jgi:Peptidase propeptide and YPEB domain
LLKSARSLQHKDHRRRFINAVQPFTLIFFNNYISFDQSRPRYEVVVNPNQDWRIRMSKMVLVGAAALVLATGSATAAPQHFAGAELLPMAKVTLAKARQRAVQARPGVITDQELEKERGGTGLRYSFDIRSKGKTFEVGIDARTGKVLENDAEGSNPD